jgi:hypothetical protein
MHYRSPMYIPIHLSLDSRSVQRLSGLDLFFGGFMIEDDGTGGWTRLGGHRWRIGRSDAKSIELAGGIVCTCGRFTSWLSSSHGSSSRCGLSFFLRRSILSRSRRSLGLLTRNTLGCCFGTVAKRWDNFLSVLVYTLAIWCLPLASLTRPTHQMTEFCNCFPVRLVVVFEVVLATELLVEVRSGYELGQVGIEAHLRVE